jgi:hypothetical protein
MDKIILINIELLFFNEQIIKVTNVYARVPKTNITTYMDKIILINIELLFFNEHTREDYLEWVRWSWI